MKRFFALSLTLLTASGLIACGGETATSEGTTTEITVAEGQQGEMTITHSRGESVVKLNPERVVVLDMGILDIIKTLGIDVEIATSTSTPGYITDISEEDFTYVGNIKEPDLEGIYTFQPDVIFMSGRQSDFYDDLNEIAPTVYVDLNSDTYMEDLRRNAITIGTLFGQEELASEICDMLEAKASAVREMAEATDETGLIILTNNGKISAYGPGSRFGIIHDTLGVKEADENMYADGEEITSHGKEVSYEYIAQVNPDILFVVDRNGVVSGDADAESTLNNDLVNSTNAAKAGKIINLDSEIWYLSSGGLTAVNEMISEVAEALNQ